MVTRASDMGRHLMLLVSAFNVFAECSIKDIHSNIYGSHIEIHPYLGSLVVIAKTSWSVMVFVVILQTKISDGARVLDERRN